MGQFKTAYCWEQNKWTVQGLQHVKGMHGKTEQGRVSLALVYPGGGGGAHRARQVGRCTSAARAGCRQQGPHSAAM